MWVSKEEIESLRKRLVDLERKVSALDSGKSVWPEAKLFWSWTDTPIKTISLQDQIDLILGHLNVRITGDEAKVFLKSNKK